MDEFIMSDFFWDTEFPMIVDTIDLTDDEIPTIIDATDGVIDLTQTVIDLTVEGLTPAYVWSEQTMDILEECVYLSVEARRRFYEEVWVPDDTIDLTGDYDWPLMWGFFESMVTATHVAAAA